MLPPAVNPGAGRVERAHGVALLGELVGQGEGEAVGGVDTAGEPRHRGEQPCLGDELRGEGARRQEQGRVVVHKVGALLLQGVQVGHVLWGEEPGVDGLQHHHQQALALVKAGVFILPADLPGALLIELVQAVQIHGAGLQAKGHHKVPDGVLVQAGQQQAAVGIGKILVGLLLGVGVEQAAPGHGVRLGQQRAVEQHHADQGQKDGPGCSSQPGPPGFPRLALGHQPRPHRQQKHGQHNACHQGFAQV